MKCFFAYKESSDPAYAYGQLLRVSVYTAVKNTSLELFCLYDGELNELTAWLEGIGVTLIRRRSYLFEVLQKIANRTNPNYLEIGGGAFLRVEIPRIMEELGYDDEFVLYTDCDVLFLNDVSNSLSAITPKYFAVAPESTENDYFAMNSGVMVMNVKNLRKHDRKFRRFVKTKIESFIPNYNEHRSLVGKILNKRFRFNPTWDQSAYQRYFSNNLFKTYQWDKLALEFNWKPYWGKSEQVQILHFHGPKPQLAYLFKSNNLPEHLKPLQSFATPAYFEYSLLWERFLNELTDSTSYN